MRLKPIEGRKMCNRTDLTLGVRVLIVAIRVRVYNLDSVYDVVVREQGRNRQICLKQNQ